VIRGFWNLELGTWNAGEARSLARCRANGPIEDSIVVGQRERPFPALTQDSVYGLKAIDVVHSLVPPHLIYESGDCGRILFQDLLLKFHDRSVLPKSISLAVVPGQEAVGSIFLTTSSHKPGIILGGWGFPLAADVAEVIQENDHQPKAT
jgi:hypothetical protein